MLDQKIADFTVGFNPGFLNSPIMWGRETIISLSNGEKHRAKFLIVDMDNIKASHNEHTFASTDGYPLNASGENINDRNYEKDLNAQARVIDAAQNLDPNIIISTSRTDSGTPIITKDGIVISGNNRTMSLKLAASQHPEKYQEYVKLLIEEINAFDIELTNGRFIPNEHSEAPFEIKQPVLVRMDYDFPEYTTAELAKYNKNRKKSERPVDVAIKIGKILNEKPACKESISNIVGNYETFSDFYSSIVDQKAMRNTLLGCEIISDNDLAQYFDNRGFTEAGKDLVENILAGIILSTKALLSGNFPGVRTIRNAIITSLPVLIKNNSLGTASIIKYVDEAFLLQSAIVASGNDFEYYMRQRTLFGENHDEKTVVINRLLNSGRNRFKAAIEAYNNAIDDNTKPSFFNDNLSAETIFEKTITARIPETDQKTIYAAFHQAQGREFMIELNRAIRENKPALYNTIENNRGQEKAVLEPLLSNAFWNIVNKNLEKWLPVVADIENNTGFNNFYDQLSDELLDEYNSMAAFEPVEKRVGGRIDDGEKKPISDVVSEPEIAIEEEKTITADPEPVLYEMEHTQIAANQTEQAINGLKTLYSMTKDKKQKKSIKAAIAGLKILQVQWN